MVRTHARARTQTPNVKSEDYLDQLLDYKLIKKYCFEFVMYVAVSEGNGVGGVCSTKVKDEKVRNLGRKS